MQVQSLTFRDRIESFSPWIILVVLGMYSYGWFFVVPYAGYNYSSTGLVGLDYELNGTGPGVIRGDRILAINGEEWESMKQNNSPPLFQGIQAGDQLSYRVLREEQELEIDGIFLGRTRQEFIDRIIVQWWLPYIFWFTGTATILFIRPKDIRWRLFIAFNYLNALWLAAGLGPSRANVFASPLVLKIGVWLFMPVFIHLSSEIPRPIEDKLPAIKSLKKFILVFFYTAAILLALGELFSVLPLNVYPLGMLVASTFGILILIFQYFLQKDQRDSIRIIYRATVIAIFPIILITFLMSLTPIESNLQGGSVLVLPLIPIAYFYAIYRHQLGAIEIKTNRIISIYLFVILIFSIAVVLIGLTSLVIDLSENDLLFSVIAAIIAGVFAINYFGRFQKFVESRILSIPIPQTDLPQTFASKITAHLDKKYLVSVIQDDVLPSLLIRQSSLVAFQDDGTYSFDYTQNLKPDQTRLDIDWTEFTDKFGSFISDYERSNFPSSMSWLRVILPLTFDNRRIGVWLLGRRDPDDYYYPAEIEILTALANQISIVLINAQQTERLRLLYQTNIDRHEQERASLSRDLHDETLNYLAALQNNFEDQELHIEIDNIILGLRKTIRGLRPEMLNFGLITALEDLGDSLNERQEITQVEVNIEGEPFQEDQNTELHIFRIVQQACDNALQHAAPKKILIEGHIHPQDIHIQIQDDGSGFEIGDSINLSNFLKNEHYGLANMYERAILIGADITIQSSQENGSKIELHWRPNSN